MALVFTAVSNALAALALRTLADDPGPIGAAEITAVVMIAVGLYGFGMALNDIIDRRRDRQIARGRPLPSGRISVGLAYLVAFLLLGLAIGGGLLFASRVPHGIVSVVFVLITAGLVAGYDYFGKYVPWVGLLMLGLIRFSHAIIPGPQLAVVWHPLWLLNHVAIISAVAYRWEAKRPPLTRKQVATLAGGLVVLNVGLIAGLYMRRGEDLADSLRLSPALLGPLVAMGVFAVVGHFIRKRANDRRAAGKALILYGLLWLIVYDALFVAGYVDWRLGVGLMLLWPVAYLAVRAMRIWAAMTEIARKPQYIRAD